MIEILHEDCMAVMARYPDNHFELAIVDPPYGIGVDASMAKKIGNNTTSRIHHEVKGWDSCVPSAKYFSELKRVSKNQIIWGGNYYPICLSGVIIWDKGENGTLPHGELAKTSIKTFKIFKMSRTDAYINNPHAKIHPTQKPVKLYEWLLTNYAKEGDKILDTHLGSGSSAIAAHYGGFDFVGCELDEDYYKAAKARFEQETRQEALF